MRGKSDRGSGRRCIGTGVQGKFWRGVRGEVILMHNGTTKKDQVSRWSMNWRMSFSRRLSAVADSGGRCSTAGTDGRHACSSVEIQDSRSKSRPRRRHCLRRGVKSNKGCLCARPICSIDVTASLQTTMTRPEDEDKGRRGCAGRSQNPRLESAHTHRIGPFTHVRERGGG